MNRRVYLHPLWYVQSLSDDAEKEARQEEELSQKGSEKQSSMAEKEEESLVSID